METVQNTSYWLDFSIESFLVNVWCEGLQKFAIDTIGESAVLEFGLLSITVQPGNSRSFCRLTLSDSDTFLTLHICLDSDDPILFQIESCTNLELAIDMLDDIVDSWRAGFFNLKQA